MKESKTKNGTAEKKMAKPAVAASATNGVLSTSNANPHDTSVVFTPPSFPHSLPSMRPHVAFTHPLMNGGFSPVPSIPQMSSCHYDYDGSYALAKSAAINMFRTRHRHRRSKSADHNTISRAYPLTSIPENGQLPSNLAAIPMMQHDTLNMMGKQGSVRMPKLQQEIRDFMELSSVSRDKHKERMHTVANAIATLAANALNCEVAVRFHGSVSTKLSIPEPYFDVDINWTAYGQTFGTALNAHETLSTIYDAMVANRGLPFVKTLPMPVYEAVFIKTGNVPIIQIKHYKDRGHPGFNVDIGFNVPNASISTAYFSSTIDQFPLFQPLTMILKLLLKVHGLNGSYEGGLGSFAIQVLVLGHFRVSVCVCVCVCVIP